jgi:hypothetical protein
LEVPPPTSSEWPPKPFLNEDGTIVEATEPTVVTWPSAFKPGDNFTHGGDSRGSSGGGQGPWSTFEADATGAWKVAAVISDAICKPTKNWTNSQLFPYQFNAAVGL